MIALIKGWRNEIFGNIFKWKKEVITRMNGIQNIVHYGHNKFLEALENDLQDQLNQTFIKKRVFGFKSPEASGLQMGI